MGRSIRGSAGSASGEVRARTVGDVGLTAGAVSAGAAAWTVGQQEAARTAGAVPVTGWQQGMATLWAAGGQPVPHPANNVPGNPARRARRRRTVRRRWLMGRSLEEFAKLRATRAGGEGSRIRTGGAAPVFLNPTAARALPDR